MYTRQTSVSTNDINDTNDKRAHNSGCVSRIDTRLLKQVYLDVDHHEVYCSIAYPPK
jgi:hypothetical protein